MQGRGTLIDLFSVYGRQHVAVGYDALMRIIEQQGAEVWRGDFLCLYTGLADALLEMCKTPDADTLRSICTGLDGGDDRLLNWISDSGVVAICADNLAVELRRPASPAPMQPGPALPLHAHCLFKNGIHLGELWYFTELAGWLKAHDRWSFLLTAPPLNLPGAVGSPLTPVATV